MRPSYYEPTDEEADSGTCADCYEPAHEDCHGLCGPCFAEACADEAANRAFDEYNERER